MTAGVTRRDALRSATCAAGAIAIPALLRPTSAAAQEGEDDDAATEDFLVEAIVVEQIAAVACATAAGELEAPRQLTRTLEQFAAQERAHAKALRAALDSLGVDPPDAPSRPDDSGAIEGIDQLDDARATELVELLAELGELSGRDAYLEYLVGLEEEQLELYLRETPEFVAEDLLRTGVEIAACQAQHIVVLREALGSPPARAVPDLPAAEPADG